MRKNKNMVTRFFSFLMALVMSLALIPATSVHAQEVNPNSATFNECGWSIATQRVTVYDDDRIGIGYIEEGEGFTFLCSRFVAGQLMAMVNYSTPSGEKTGYIKPLIGWDLNYTTCAGVVNATTTVYYGKNTNQYQVAGTVSAGEYVSILAEAAGKYCIEFNTNAGRKRGWCSTSTITKKLPKDYDVTLGQLPCNATFVNTNRTYSSRDVYAGPSTAYCKVGAIGTSSPTETVYITAEYTYNGQKWAYITYSVPGQKDKSGYIRID